MNEVIINKISDVIITPSYLKTTNFDIDIKFYFREDYQDSIFEGSQRIYNFNNINLWKKEIDIIYKIVLPKNSNLISCINFFKSLYLKSNKLFEFYDWDDEKDFDFLINYDTNFYFKIKDLKKFCKFYNKKFNYNTFKIDVKNIIINEFLNI